MKSELVPANGRGTHTDRRRDLTVIGRREFCDVHMPDDPSLSKRHAVIVRTDGLLIVRDLASTNGTKVNGQRVMWAALLPNDRLTLGRYKFRVYLGPDTAPGPSETYVPPRGRAVRKSPPPLPAADGFPPPSSASSGLMTTGASGSTDPDAELELVEEFVMEEDEEFVIDLD